MGCRPIAEELRIIHYIFLPSAKDMRFTWKAGQCGMEAQTILRPTPVRYLVCKCIYPASSKQMGRLPKI